MQLIIKKYSNQQKFIEAKEKIEDILKGTAHTIEISVNDQKELNKDNTIYNFESYIKVKIDKNQIEKIKALQEIP